MSAWSWAIVGTAVFLVISAVVSLALAAILGQIGQEVSELLEEPDFWSTAPLIREEIQAEQEATTEQAPASDSVSAHESESRRAYFGSSR
jgi:hypothetical protein